MNNTIVESEARERVARACPQSPDVARCMAELAGPVDHIDTSKCKFLKDELVLRL